MLHIICAAAVAAAVQVNDFGLLSELPTPAMASHRTKIARTQRYQENDRFVHRIILPNCTYWWQHTMHDEPCS